MRWTTKEKSEFGKWPRDMCQSWSGSGMRTHIVVDIDFRLWATSGRTSARDEGCFSAWGLGYWGRSVNRMVGIYMVDFFVGIFYEGSALKLTIYMLQHGRMANTILLGWLKGMVEWDG